VSAIDLANGAIAAWNRGDVKDTERRLLILMNTYRADWIETLCALEPPREMMKRLIQLETHDGQGVVIVKDRGESS